MSSEQAAPIENGEVEEVEATPAVDGFNKNAVLASLLQDPNMLAQMEKELANMSGKSSGYIESLPQAIKNRVNALKNIQLESMNIEAKFFEEAHELEMKYAKMFEPLYEKRKKVVNAEYEPTEEECKWKEPGLDEDEEEEEEEKEEEKDEEKGHDFDENTKGIPYFWYTAMGNCRELQEMIQEHDEPILKCIDDIRLIFTKKNAEDADSKMGFVLEFHFIPNDYFTNEALTKTYIMSVDPDEDDPWAFDGPNIVGCTGCKIDWKSGKNVTEKTVKKKQNNKRKGQSRVVTKTVKNDSFFNFFSPPEVPEGEEEEDDDIQTLLEADFEMGHFIRDQLIPRAVLYFTGEAVEEDTDDEDDDYDDDDELESDEDPDYQPPANGEKPQECNQQ